MGKRRPKKRYGSIKGKGRTCWVPWKKEPKRAPMWYSIRAGTPCHVRRIGSDVAWQAHTTKKDIRCHGFLWRNSTHHGFAQGEFEVKVPNGSFRCFKTNSNG
jgi:hypothetical protein